MYDLAFAEKIPFIKDEIELIIMFGVSILIVNVEVERLYKKHLDSSLDLIRFPL